MGHKLSIITINYNDKAGLKKTFDSVFNQTCLDFEYIVIDGASTDGSKEFIEENASMISYWISEPDKGIFNAMNKGIQASKGDFLLFLNSGDCLYANETIATVLNKLEVQNSIYYGNMVTSVDNVPKAICTPPETLNFSFFLIFSLPHQASFIKRELFYDFFMYNETYKIISDWEFFIYAICKQNVPYKYLDITISNFDETGVSSNTNNQERLNQEKLNVLKQHFPTLIEDSELLKEIKTKRFQQFIKFKEHKFSWKLMKFFMNVLDLFHKKSKSEFSNYYKQLK